MKTILLKRFLMLFPTLLGVSFLTYLVIYLAPGGPAAGLMADLNPKISPEYKQELAAYYNYDKPFLVQYGLWLKKLVRLDLGISRKDNQPVIKKICERLPKTLLLTLSSLLLTLLLAVPIGIFSALKQHTMVDRFFTVFVFLGFSVPTFWVAILCMIFFGIRLGWFPITGFESLNSDDLSLVARVLDVLHHLALPLIVTALTGLASLSRYVRNGMLDVLGQDYIRTARAKGLSERRVVLVHAFRNILIPLVTILGFSLPELISAGVIFEIIFSYPGLGRMVYEAVMSRDIFLLMASGLFSALLTLLGNFIADVLYSVVDPRIRTQ